MGIVDIKVLVFGYNHSCLEKDHTDSTRKYSEDDIIKILDFVIDKIFVELGGFLFQQAVGIPIGTTCATLLPYFFLGNSYEAEFILF